MTGPTHSVRNSLIDRERTFSLGTEALQWKETGRHGELPYAAISRMRLIAYPSTGGEHRQCSLFASRGRKIKLRSHHYRSLGAFDDRTDTYAPFVRELSRRIAAASPGAKFLAGSTSMWLVWLGLSTLIAVVGILLLTVVVGGEVLQAGVIAPLVVLAIVVPGAWKILRRGKAVEFDPAEPPADLTGAQRPIR